MTEYISQLEGEIAQKVNENSDLRAQNKALMEENTRLSDLTRMLLSSPSFSGFLDTLSTNPAGAIPQQQAPVEQRPVESRQMRKDVNPYERQPKQTQQMHMAILPEHHMDFSMLDMNNDGAFNYTQPQVFSVLDIPEAAIDVSILSGKTAEDVAPVFDNEKIELPTIKRVPAVEVQETQPETIVDDEFDADPAFALFANPPTLDAATTASQIQHEEYSPIFGSITPEKALARIELVDAADDDAICAAAMTRFERLGASLEAIMARLEAMTINY